MIPKIDYVVIPKKGYTEEECEDSFHFHPQHRDPVHNYKFAVADGATETSFSREWACLLTQSIQERSSLNASHLLSILPQLQAKWKENVFSRPLPYYAEIKPNYVTPDMEEGFNVASRNEVSKVRYWSIPGTEGFGHRNGGLEKDYVTGGISTDALNHQLMVDTREQKVNNVSQILPELKVEGNKDADLLVIGWGGTHGHLMSAVNSINKNGKKIALAHFNYINPLPKNAVELIQRYKKVVVCELNSGQFANLLRSKVSGVEFLQYNKVQGQPFTVAELEECFIQLLK